LQAIAAAARLSPFHFHRVFKAILGETLNQFVKRLRLERALYLMSHAPKQSLTQVALDCGFSSSNDFSRSFKQHFGTAPRTFDLERFRQARRAEFERVFSNQTDAKVQSLPVQQNPDGFTVTLRDLPARSVAYIRVFNPYREGVVQSACERLLAWAAARGLSEGQWLGYMWEEPETVALTHCRYDAALVIDTVDLSWQHNFVGKGEIGRFDFPAMRVAEVVIRGDIAQEVRAIDWLYQAWLPNSGYVPDDQPAFEAWLGLPFAHGSAHFELAFQLPIKRETVNSR
jgi:AraC family transcriptional regulator